MDQKYPSLPTSDSFSLEGLDKWSDQLALLKKEWIESLRSLPLSDETCLNLIKCHFSETRDGHKACEVPIPTYLHICVNKPPCSINEREETTNGRKWCKNRGFKLGTPEFDAAAMYAEAMYTKAEEDRLKRLYDVNPELKEQAAKAAQELKEIQLIVSRATRLSEDDDTELTENFERIDTLSVSEFSKELETKIKSDPKNAKRTLVKTSQALQLGKIKNEVGSIVLTVTRDSTRQVLKNMKEDIAERKLSDTKIDKEEIEKAGTDTSTNSAIEKLTRVVLKLDERLNKMETGLTSIDTKQDRVLDLAETIKSKQELKEYTDLWYTSKMGIIKKIALAPLQALNIIVWKPAKYSFWHFFGKYFYLMWGLLMLLLILVVFLTATSTLNIYFPEITGFLYDAYIYLQGASIRSGSILAQWLTPMFGESFMLLFNTARQGVSQSLLYLWNWLVSFIISIFQAVAGQVGSAISFLPKFW